MNDELLEVAKIGRSVGLKGFLKLINLSDFPKQFKKGAQFLDKDYNVYTVKQMDTKNQLILFEEFESVESAKGLTNLILYQSIEKTLQDCKLKEGEFFYFDVLHCEVFEEDLKLGDVIDILETPCSYLFCVKTDENLLNKKMPKEFYIPYIDKYIVNIDIFKKQIFTQNTLDILENS